MSKDYGGSEAKALVKSHWCRWAQRNNASEKTEKQSTCTRSLSIVEKVFTVICWLILDIILAYKWEEEIQY